MKKSRFAVQVLENADHAGGGCGIAVGGHSHEFHSIGDMNYRPNFHIAPPLGRLNDPNGVFLDGDTLHVYYQHDPYANPARAAALGVELVELEELMARADFVTIHLPKTEETSGLSWP